MEWRFTGLENNLWAPHNANRSLNEIPEDGLRRAAEVLDDFRQVSQTNCTLNHPWAP